MRIISLLFVFILTTSNLLADETCERYFLSSAQQELAVQKDIDKFIQRTTSIRKVMKDEYTQTQISALSRSRLFSYYLQKTENPEPLFNAFMGTFRNVEESYLILSNYRSRLKKFKQFLSEEGTGRVFERDAFLESIGHARPVSKDFKKHIQEITEIYNQEIPKLEQKLVDNYDEYVLLEINLKNLVESPDVSDAQRAHFDSMMGTLKLNLKNIQSRRSLFMEQINANEIPEINTALIKQLFDSNLLLHRSIWQKRYRDQLNGLAIHAIYKVRLHERFIHYLNRRITSTAPVIERIRKVMAAVSKKLIDYEMISEYTSRIAQQVEPIIRARPIAHQFEVMLAANTLSERVDEYFIALARSVDSRQAWNDLIKYAKDEVKYADVYERMLKAQNEARILGDTRVPEGRPKLLPVTALTLTEALLTWMALEYAGIVDFIPDKHMNPMLEDLNKVMDDMNIDPKKANEVLQLLEAEENKLPDPQSK